MHLVHVGWALSKVSRIYLGMSDVRAENSPNIMSLMAKGLRDLYQEPTSLTGVPQT